LSLSAHSFSVEHKPGKKIPHVDALSLHVGTILQNEDLNPGLFCLEQGKEGFCQSLRPSTYPDKSEYFLDEAGLIYRRRPDDRNQLLVPKALINDVIWQNHEPVFIGHPGIKRTCDLIALSFWWPGMRKSIEDYIKNCDACQRGKDHREYKAPLGEVENPTGPSQISSIDVTGPYHFYASS